MTTLTRSTIRQALLTSATAFDPQSATAEEAEIAAGQVLVADQLLTDQSATTGLDTLDAPDSRWRLYTKNFPSHVALTTDRIDLGIIPNIIADQLYMGGIVERSSSNLNYLFVSGPLGGDKTPVFGAYSIPAINFIQRARMQLDPIRGPYFFANNSGGSTYHSRTARTSGPLSNIVGFCFHAQFGRSIVVGGSKQIVTGADSGGAHTAATLPDLSAVNFALAPPCCSPTAVLIATSAVNSSTVGFLRSTDGVTYSLIPGITALSAVATIFSSEFVNGRLYLATSRGLWSTADDGGAWRQDIAQANSIDRLHVMSDGRLLAHGASGIWHGAGDGTGFARVSTTDPGVNTVLVPEQRILYGAAMYSEAGRVLLAGSDLDSRVYPNASRRNVAGPADTVTNIVSTTSPIIVPDGPDSVLLLTSSTTGPTALIRQCLPIFVPPRTGQQVCIVAIGSGGDLFHPGTLSAPGWPTIVSNLAVAPGGIAGQDTFDRIPGRIGASAVPVSSFQFNSSADSRAGLFRAEGAPGIVIKGKRFGDGLGITFPADPIGSSHLPFSGITSTNASPQSVRGGASPLPLVLRRFVTDPLPMVIPDTRHSRVVGASASQTDGDYQLSGPRGAEWGMAPGGAVAILEL